MKMYTNVLSLTCPNPNSITGNRNSNCATIVPTINAHIFAKWFSTKISPHSLTTPVSLDCCCSDCDDGCLPLPDDIAFQCFDFNLWPPPSLPLALNFGRKTRHLSPIFPRGLTWHHRVAGPVSPHSGVGAHNLNFQFVPKKTVVRCLPACVHFYFVVFSGSMSVSILFMRILLLTICTRFGIATSFGNKPSVMNIQLCNGFKNCWMLPEIDRNNDCRKENLLISYFGTNSI